MNSGTSRMTPVRRPVIRRPGMALASVGLVALSMAVFCTMYARAGGRETVVIGIRHLVSMGQTIDSSDLTQIGVKVGDARGSMDLVPASAEPDIVGRRAAIPLLPGTLLARHAVTAAAVPADGVALVGVGLRPDQLPASGVSIGDRVDAVLTGGTGGALALGSASPQGSTSSAFNGNPGSVLAHGVVVVDVAGGPGAAAGAQNGAGSGTTSSQSPVEVVTLEVARADAPLLAAASTAGEAALVVVGPQ